MTEVPDPETLKPFNNDVADEFRANGGQVGGQFAGHDLLTTTGAKSGQPRLSPLAHLTVDGKLLIIAGYGGADINPAWVHNLRAKPTASRQEHHSHVAQAHPRASRLPAGFDVRLRRGVRDRLAIVHHRPVY